MPASVVISASGIVTTLGSGTEKNVSAIRKGQGSYGRVELHDFDEAVSAAYLPACTNDHIDAEGRIAWLLDQAITDLLSKTSLTGDDIASMPVFVGSSSYGIGLGEERYRNALATGEDALPLPLDGFTQISRHLRERHGFAGADFSYNTACTASANALLSAATSIRYGNNDYALVVGLESFNTTTLAGFYGMQLLSAEEMRPFCKRRGGLVLGEGCSVLLLRKASDDEPGFHLVGGASSCDTHSITASNPDGSAIADVMHRALNHCQLKPEHITAIKAHGTASPLNDDGEAAGVHRVFSEVPPLFSLKSYVGHTLGSCGAIETALLTSCIDAGFIPKSAGFQEADPALGLEPLVSSQSAETGHYMFNFFGFGGNNCSLIIDYRN